MQLFALHNCNKGIGCIYHNLAMFYMMQDQPVCSNQEQNDCIKSISTSFHECLPKCEGVLVTSFFKSENTADAEVVAPKLMQQYNKYKKFVKFPGYLKSKYGWFC